MSGCLVGNQHVPGCVAYNQSHVEQVQSLKAGEQQVLDGCANQPLRNRLGDTGRIPLPTNTGWRQFLASGCARYTGDSLERSLHACVDVCIDDHAVQPQSDFGGNRKKGRRRSYEQSCSRLDDPGLAAIPGLNKLACSNCWKNGILSLRFGAIVRKEGGYRLDRLRVALARTFGMRRVL